MSLHIDFDAHSWFMGFAIKCEVNPNDGINRWGGFTDNGNTYAVDELWAFKLSDLKERIRAYHLGKRNGYGERIAKNRLASIRESIEAESVSYGEIAELQALWNYIDKSDTLLLEWAAMPEEPKG